MLGAAPFNTDGSAFSMLVAPGDPEGSLLYQRDRSVAFGERMPPLGRTRADEAYLRLLERWILAL